MDRRDDAQERRYTLPVDPAEAEAWQQQNGHAEPYPGMATMSDEGVCHIVWGAIGEGAPKAIALDTWALERFANLYESNETRFAQLVILPATDLHVPIGELLAAMHRLLRHRHTSAALPLPQSGSSIIANTYPPATYFVAGMLHEGLTLLAGKMKRGKSYLALNMAMDISFGRKAFQSLDTIQSRVLYVSLEDHAPLIQERLQKIQPNLTTLPDVDFVYTLPPLGQGAFEALQHYASIGEYRVFILDTIGRLTPDFGMQRRQMNEYATITHLLGPLQAWANTQRIAIVMVDHVRKAEADDIFDTVMGSSAKMGIADHGIVYQRKDYDSDALLHMRGRRIGDDKVVLTLVDGHLEFLGQGEQYDLSREQRQVLKALEEDGLPMKIKDIMESTGVPAGQYGRFKKVLQRMLRDGLVDRTGHGAYCALKRSDYDDSVPTERQERERYP